MKVMFDDRTEHYDLPIPNTNNRLIEDVSRIRTAFTIIDQFLKDNADAIGVPDGLATLDADGHVPLLQLSQSSRTTEMSDLWDDMTGVVLDYALSTPPSAAWRLCYGQTLLAADTPAANLRQKLIADGFPYGQDESGNPKVPDYRGRTAAGKDDMGGTAANRLTGAKSGIDGTTLGAAGGAETHTLTTAQMPSHAHAVTDPGHNHTITDPGHSHSVYDPTHAHSVYDPGHQHTYYSSNANDGGSGSQYQNTATLQNSSNTGAATTGIGIYGAYTGISIYAAGTGISVNSKVTGISVQNNGGGLEHNNTQPTIVMNKIIKL